METRTIRWERGQLVDAPALPTPVPGLSIVTQPLELANRDDYET